MTKLTQDTFHDIVNEELRFLVFEHNFQKGVPQGQWGVRIESKALRLDVSREHNSDIVFCSIFRKDTNAIYGLQEILLALYPEAVPEARCSTRDTLALRQGLKRIVGLCKNQLRGVFELDKAVFDLVDVHVGARRDRLTLSARFGNDLRRANTAWEAKKWTDAFVLYSGAERALAPYQKRRLEFLRKRLRPK